MRIAAATALLALLCDTAAPARAPAAPPRNSTRFTVYDCNGYVGSGEGAGGSIELNLSYLEDGTLRSKSVSFYAQNASLIGASSPATASVQLRWPGEHRVGHEGEAFDWSQGSVRISLSTSYARPRKDERWRRVLVDRGDAVTTHVTGGIRYAFPSALRMIVASEPGELSSSPGLEMALDDLIAWGRGVPSLTVYEVLVEMRRPGRGESPSHFMGAHRVVGAYTIDTARLEATAREVRRRAEEWQAGVNDFRKQCRRREESDDPIIVT